MKQKIVLQMQLDCDKCRSKALKIAAQEIGVSSVALEGDSKDKLVVTGDVDAVCLGRVLRKKFRCVTLVSVNEVKKKDDNKCKIEDKKVCYYYPPYCPPPTCAPPPYCHPAVYDSYDSNCSIM
ncbi:Heavy metal-associated isoprenylated plant protein 47, partial [Mucuna pruriens]